jgi:hypothetical protein
VNCQRFGRHRLGFTGPRHSECQAFAKTAGHIQQPLNAKALELPLAQSREVGCGITGPGLGLPNGQPLTVQRAARQQMSKYLT